MPVIRCTLFFRQEGYGWTESYFKDGPSNDPSSYADEITLLAQKRAKCSGQQTYITNARTSVEGVFRDAFLLGFVGNGIRGTFQRDSDNPTTALLLRCRNQASTKFKNNFMRGIWDDVVTAGGKYNPTAEFQAALNDYVAQVFAGAWGWLGATSVAQANVLTVTQLASGLVGVTVDADLTAGPFPLDTTVRISGVLGATQINGSPIVRFTDARTLATRRRISIFPYQAEGKVRLNTKTVIPIFVIAPQRIVERRVGRPSYLSRGRRSA